MQSSVMQNLRWMRVPGDVLFSIGAASFAWFVLGLLTGHSYVDETSLGGRSQSGEAREEREPALAGR
ncbi:MAG: hypothetical protein WA476_14820 [Acidobacteriaceae bacterium]